MPVFHHRFHMDREYRFPRELRAQAVRAQDRLPLEEDWSWEEAGPGGIDIEVRETNSWQGDDDIGGLVMDVVVRDSPDFLALSTIMGGVWVSPVGGNGWLPRGDHLDSLGCAALAHWSEGIDEVLYAASGSPADERSRQIQSIGILRSVNGGAWAVLDGGTTASRFIDRDVNAMVAFDLDKLMVATDQGLFYSVDGGRNFGRSPNYDDGQPIYEGRITDLKGDVVGGTPTFWFAKAQDGLYSGTLPPTRAGISRIHRPRSVEGAGDVGLMVFDRVSDPSGETWALSVTKHGESDAYHSLQYRAPGTPWRKLIPGGSNPPHNGFTFEQMRYNHVLTLDPDAPTRAYLGAVNLYRFPVPTDMPAAGWSPAELSRGEIHADQHGSAWDTATSPSSLYVANDGGVYRTTNNGSDWTNLNGTLRANLIYGMDVAKRGSGWEVLIGMQDCGNALGKTPEVEPDVPDWSWTYEGGGDGGEVALQPESETRAMQFSNAKIRYGERANAGADFRWRNAQLGGSTFENDKFRFSGTVAWARNASGDWNDVYVGLEQPGNRGRLFKSTNAGVDFTRLSPRVGGTALSEFESPITVIRTASSNPANEGDASPPAWTHVWIGLLNGKVGRSTDGGANFTFMQPGPGLPVVALAVDPTNSNRVAVGYGGFSGITAGRPTGHVWLTSNAGTDWSDIGGNILPDLAAHSLVFSRTNPVGLFVGNDAGVLYTTGPNFGDQWKRIGLGLPRVRANALRVVDAPRTDPPPVLDATHPPALFVGTHGRSVFRLHRPSSGKLVVDGELDFGTVVGAGPVDRTVTLRNPGGSTLRITSLSVSAPFSLQGAPATPFDIPAGGSRDLTVRYAPASDGPNTEYLRIGLDNPDPVLDEKSIVCSGERVAAGKPRLGIDPLFVAIPSGEIPGGQADVPIRVTNGGAAALSISGIDRNGSGDFSMLTSGGAAITFPLAIAAGETVALMLRLSTTDTNLKRADFVFHSNDPTGDRTLKAERPGPEGGFPTWATILIIVGSVVVAAGIGFLIYDAVKESDPKEVQGT
jgi:hypothetical protein